MGNRTSCRSIQPVIILVIKQIINHPYDYTHNWAPLSPVTITYTRIPVSNLSVSVPFPSSTLLTTHHRRRKLQNVKSLFCPA